MLKQIRGNMKRAVALIFIAPLLVGFAAWGVPEISQFSRSDPVRVGNTGFTGLSVQREFDRYATNRRLAGDESFSREGAIAAGVPDQLVQSLVTRAALDQDALKMGLRVPREAVREFLQTSDQFKNPRTGKFDNEVLDNILREYNYGVREFEARLQSDLLRDQLTSAVVANGKAPNALVDALVLRETERRTISYLTVTKDLAGAAAEETPEALKEYYEANSAQFMAPEYRTFTAVILNDQAFSEDESISDEELLKIYDATKARYQTPERRTLHQITFSDDEAARAAAQALKDGKPFENIASDEGKSLADVTLTDVQKNEIVDPDVANAVFAAKAAGDVVGPIKGVFGNTVVQLVSISPASEQTFEEVRDQIASDAQSRDSKRKLFEAVETIENARDTGASLADAAESANTAASHFGPVDSFSFGAGGEIVSGIPGDVLKEAFRLDEGEESDAIEFKDKSGYFFVVVNEIKPAAVMPYEDVADEVATRWRSAEEKGRVARTVKSIRDEIDSGKTLKEAAQTLNRAPITQTINRRDAAEPLSESVVEQIFAASKGDIVSGPAAIGDAQIIISVDDISFDASAVSPSDISVFTNYVGGQIGRELADAYAGAVVADAKPRIRQDQIDALFSDVR
ncbi:MAG: peptidyl-prolyl cis-trans isomerase [Parvularculaceae bacterium]|nr:peptidyl-prolyl cis-trans isomerase [Parvularculaceae bacterium]